MGGGAVGWGGAEVSIAVMQRTPGQARTQHSCGVASSQRSTACRMAAAALQCRADCGGAGHCPFPPTFLCRSDSQKGRKVSTIAAASSARASSPSSQVSTHSMLRSGAPAGGACSPKCTLGPA